MFFRKILTLILAQIFLVCFLADLSLGLELSSSLEIGRDQNIPSVLDNEIYPNQYADRGGDSFKISENNKKTLIYKVGQIFIHPAISICGSFFSISFLVCATLSIFGIFKLSLPLTAICMLTPFVYHIVNYVLFFSYKHDLMFNSFTLKKGQTDFVSQNQNSHKKKYRIYFSLMAFQSLLFLATTVCVVFFMSYASSLILSSLLVITSSVLFFFSIAPLISLIVLFFKKLFDSETELKARDESLEREKMSSSSVVDEKGAGVEFDPKATDDSERESLPLSIHHSETELKPRDESLEREKMVSSLVVDEKGAGVEFDPKATDDSERESLSLSTYHSETELTSRDEPLVRKPDGAGDIELLNGVNAQNVDGVFKSHRSLPASVILSQGDELSPRIQGVIAEEDLKQNSKDGLYPNLEKFKKNYGILDSNLASLAVRNISTPPSKKSRDKLKENVERVKISSALQCWLHKKSEELKVKKHKEELKSNKPIKKLTRPIKMFTVKLLEMGQIGGGIEPKRIKDFDYRRPLTPETYEDVYHRLIRKYDLVKGKIDLLKKKEPSKEHLLSLDERELESYENNLNKLDIELISFFSFEDCFWTDLVDFAKSSFEEIDKDSSLTSEHLENFKLNFKRYSKHMNIFDEELTRVDKKLNSILEASDLATVNA
ncbi:hypothetical protein AB834_05695 [PVC group bacterium (ex Bugula neritina AB1)]|nr:hypothetical protein AB834_05695 [PVC group bacterium (ex Bugula neritina AB1)]